MIPMIPMIPNVFDSPHTKCLSLTKLYIHSYKSYQFCSLFDFLFLFSFKTCSIQKELFNYSIYFTNSLSLFLYLPSPCSLFLVFDLFLHSTLPLLMLVSEGSQWDKILLVLIFKSYPPSFSLHIFPSFLRNISIAGQFILLILTRSFKGLSFLCSKNEPGLFKNYFWDQPSSSSLSTTPMFYRPAKCSDRLLRYFPSRPYSHRPKVHQHHFQLFHYCFWTARRSFRPKWYSMGAWSKACGSRHTQLYRTD